MEALVRERVWLVMAQDKGPDDAEPVSYVVGVYGTQTSADSAKRRHEEMRDPRLRGVTYVQAEEVRP